MNLQHNKLWLEAYKHATILHKDQGIWSYSSLLILIFTNTLIKAKHLQLVWTFNIQHAQKKYRFHVNQTTKDTKAYICKTNKVPIFQKIQVKFWCSQLILSLTCIEKNGFPGLY